MILYILVSGEGEYSDRSETPIAAYTSATEADRVCGALNALCAERTEIYRTARAGNWIAVDRLAREAVSDRASLLLPEGITLQSDYVVTPVPVIS